MSLEVGPLRADDAKPLARRSFHHPPSLDVSDSLGAKCLQPPDLGLDVVRLDVDVNSALMIDRLHQYLDRVVGGRESR